MLLPVEGSKGARARGLGAGRSKSGENALTRTSWYRGEQARGGGDRQRPQHIAAPHWEGQLGTHQGFTKVSPVHERRWVYLAWRASARAPRAYPPRR